MKKFPVAVIGAGPVGLAAAAHLFGRGLLVKVYEAGEAVGSNIPDWGHVRVFTPWRYCVDDAAKALLDRHHWNAPPADALPTGAELVDAYLEPLARTPELAVVVETSVRVAAISREGNRQGCQPRERSSPLRAGGCFEARSSARSGARGH